MHVNVTWRTSNLATAGTGVHRGDQMALAAEKKDEKVEKRRAFGRGVESLLPGPRVVAPIPSSTTEGGETKVPRFARDDNGIPAPEEKSARVEVTPIQPQATAGNQVVNLEIALIE